MKLGDKKCSDEGGVPPLKARRARELLKTSARAGELTGRGIWKGSIISKTSPRRRPLRTKLAGEIKGLTESDFVLAANVME